ncbi:MAG: hypothetical protein IAG13_09450 [Deltaproteobacteria bacterium]|nr:hypothetical protein [Nannocystaceae bacterium]
MHQIDYAWGGYVRDKTSGERLDLPRKFIDVNEAKLAAFDLMVVLEARRRRR